MADLKAYLRQLRTGGRELILETASTDSGLPDADYERLFQAVTVDVKRGKRGGLGYIGTLQDRDHARAVAREALS